MTTKLTEERRGAVVAFWAPDELIAGLDAISAEEGISRSDVARRAAIRELRRNAKRDA
jgi:metal-responsive CopG/Arc/MetJ family transcriptional regulator